MEVFLKRIPYTMYLTGCFLTFPFSVFCFIMVFLVLGLNNKCFWLIFLSFPSPSPILIYHWSRILHSQIGQHPKSLKKRECSNTRGEIVRGSYTFSEKHWLPTWAHELAKAGETLDIPVLVLYCLCSKPFSLQSLCNHLGFQKGQNWEHLQDTKGWTPNSGTSSG
jgi:hypothetical protein